MTKPPKHGLDDFLYVGGDLESLVANAIPAAELEKVGDGAKSAIARLSALPNLDYEMVRQPEADALGIRVTKLDAFVAEQRKETGAKAEGPPQWAPPGKVHDQPVDGKQLFDELTAAIKKFVNLADTAVLIVALWILFTWVFESIAETNPYLRIISPTHECGKSTLLKVIMRLARIGWIVSRLTASSFVRTMQHERRTLLLDEGDAFLKHNEVMRNVLDGASDPDTANVSMSVKVGDDWQPAEFNTFVPISIASIGVLWSMRTLESRSIAVHLRRAMPGELKQLLKGRRRELKEALEPLAAKCARWAADNADKLKGARPNLPESLSGRDQDKWEPLIIIADAIGLEQGLAARLAAIKMAGAKDGNDDLRIAVLADIRQMFSQTSEDKLASKDICDRLKEMEGRPWAEYGKKEKPISQNQLARLLSPFVIVPHKIRLTEDSTPNGYYRKDFEDAWEHYLPPTTEPTDAPNNTDTSIFQDPDWHSSTTSRPVGESGDFQASRENSPGGSKNGTLPYGDNECATVPGGNRDHTDIQVSTTPKAHVVDIDEEEPT